MDLVHGGGKLHPRLVGIGQASTFTGFCKGHDGDLFRPVDAEPLVPTGEQVSLLAYRALCREIVGKMVVGRNIPLMRKSDRGNPLWRQIITQMTANEFADHVCGALPGLSREERAWHQVVRQRAYERVSYVVIRLGSMPDVVCCGVSQPDKDFAGQVLIDLRQTSSRQDSVAFALVPGEAGGFAFFAWLDEFREAEQFVRSLLELAQDRIPNQLVRYAFETFDNVWLSPAWWESLPHQQQLFLIERMNTGNLPFIGDTPDPYSLRDNGMVFVQWTISEVQTVIHGRVR